MSEGEKRKCYFIQYSDEFLYDTKVQKLYGTPNTGKAAIAVYLQLMLIAAKSGGLIVHDYPLYQTLGEQLQPIFLHTTKEEIDAVIRYFSKAEFKGKYIHVVDDIYTFVQAQTMTQSKTIGAINKANQRANQKNKPADNVGLESAGCLPSVGNNNNNNNNNTNIYSYMNINNNNIRKLLLDVDISETDADDLLQSWGEQSVKESYLYAIVKMPPNVRTKAGFIISCIQRNRRLSENEKEKILKEAENAAIEEKKKLEREEEIAAKELEREKLEKEAQNEFIETVDWWHVLADAEREKFWLIAKDRLYDFQKKCLRNFLTPDDLTTLTEVIAKIMIPKLTEIRKELNNEYI